jgi:hypothetical protein
MNKRFWYPILAVAALAVGALACEFNIGGPATPEERVPVSTEAVESLNDIWKSALDISDNTGQLNIVVNESQLTSLLAFNLQKQEQPFIQDPQVFLRDGQIQIFGTATQSNLMATVRIVLTVDVNDEGVPEFNIVSADFGPLPVPEELLNGLSVMMDEAFTGSIGPVATGIRVENIIISNGLMSLSGRVR